MSAPLLHSGFKAGHAKRQANSDAMRALVGAARMTGEMILSLGLSAFAASAMVAALVMWLA